MLLMSYRGEAGCRSTLNLVPVPVTQIPHYNLRAATEAIKPILGPYYRTPAASPGIIPSHLVEPLVRHRGTAAAARDCRTLSMLQAKHATSYCMYYSMYVVDCGPAVACWSVASGQQGWVGGAHLPLKMYATEWLSCLASVGCGVRGQAWPGPYLRLRLASKLYSSTGPRQECDTMACALAIVL